MVNWDALGAIGDVIGAIGVLVTLIYLAMQIKHNSALAMVQINQSGLEAFSRYRVLCIENSEIISKTYKAECLSDAERTIAQAIVSEALFASASLYETSRVTNPARVLQFIKVGAELVRRHNWRFDEIKPTLDNAGYVEFTTHLVRELEGAGGDSRPV